MSRLKREGNPPSNQLASPVPQAWDPSINDFREITGQNLGGGRFGTDGVQWGKTASGLFMPIRVTNDGTQEVQLSGTKVVESAPVTGIKTVTSTVAEVFAGSSRKANRSKLVIRNLHQAVAIRIGGSNITDTIGQSLEPGASVEIDFSPSTAVPIYAVSTAGNVSVEVLEV